MKVGVRRELAERERRVALVPDSVRALAGHDGVEVLVESGAGEPAGFPDDAYVSSRHCQIVAQGDHAHLEDLGSSNGTYFRLRRGHIVPFGSYLLVGQQLFRLDRTA